MIGGLPLRVLVADDESVARRRMVRLLSVLPGVVLAGECADGAEVLARLAAGDVDVVLLDIRMPRLTGTEVLDLVGTGGPAVVFVTAHAEHAVEAFAGDAVDYLLKPVEGERLAAALDRVRRRLGEGAPGAAPSPRPPPARLPVATRKGVILLDPSDVLAVEIDGASCLVHVVGGASHLTDQRLSDLESRLPASSFVRVHRQALVNLDHVERLVPLESGGYTAVLAGGRTVPVSRQAARHLRRTWDLPR